MLYVHCMLFLPFVFPEGDRLLHVDCISMFVGHIGSLRYPYYYYFFFFTIFLLESQQRENKEEHANSQNSKITERK